jgi:hypothetical protein
MRASDEFRQNARDCVRLAQKADTAQSRDLLLQLAQTWIRFADQADLIKGMDQPEQWRDGDPAERLSAA